MKQKITTYYKIIKFIYSLSDEDHFTIQQLRRKFKISEGQLRTILSNLTTSNFVYPFGNRGYKVNLVKANFSRNYECEHRNTHIIYRSNNFEMIFKSTNYFICADLNDVKTELLSKDLFYLIAFMFIYIKEYKVHCIADIFSTNNNIVFKRKYYLSSSNIHIFTCSFKSIGPHLTFGII